MRNVNLLDCTLRDGGYINDWNFGERNIKRIINHLSDARIDIIECGFLQQKRPYDPDRSLFDSVMRIKEFFPVSRKQSKYVCMINFGEYDAEAIPDHDGSSIDGIRVVFHKHDCEAALELCRKLITKGYMLFIQPMVTMNYSDLELLNLVKEVNMINPYAFYIVDSFGVMRRNDLIRIFYLVDNNLAKTVKIGYHSHNNMQLAYSNAQSLVEYQTKRDIVIDSSVFGMGRGAGNLNTEMFVDYMNTNHGAQYDIQPLLHIIDETLNKIYKENYWGYSLPHFLSSVYNCHPNYASYLAGKSSLTVKTISSILNGLPNNKKENYDKSLIEELYAMTLRHIIDDSESMSLLSGELKGKRILIIAPGSSILENSKKIAHILHEPDTVGISINFIPDAFDCQYVFISNERRYETIRENLDPLNLNHKLLLTSNIKEDRIPHIPLNYSSLLNDILPVTDNAALMLLKLLQLIGVKTAQIAGVDGYSLSGRNYIDNDMSITLDDHAAKDRNTAIAEVLNAYSANINMEFETKPIFQSLLKFGAHENKGNDLLRRDHDMSKPSGVFAYSTSKPA